MNKLLKSILIATASVGAVAGSTATVVSCGSGIKDPANKVLETVKLLLATGITAGGADDAAKKSDAVNQVSTTVKALVTSLKETPKSGGTDCSKIDETKITADNFTVVSYTAVTEQDNGTLELTWKVFGTDGSTVVTNPVSFMLIKSA